MACDVTPEMTSMARGELVFIRNIPDRFRSSDLRRFFEEAIEAEL